MRWLKRYSWIAGYKNVVKKEIFVVIICQKRIIIFGKYVKVFLKMCEKIYR